MPRLNSSQRHKKELLSALEKSLGVVTEACLMAGLDRTTFYYYYNNDLDFKKEVDDIENITLDFAESTLYRRIKAGDTTAIIFYLKTKGKRRGYIEKQLIEHGFSPETIQKYGQKLLEVIMSNVDDPEVRKKLAAGFLSINIDDIK